MLCRRLDLPDEPGSKTNLSLKGPSTAKGLHEAAQPRSMMISAGPAECLCSGGCAGPAFPLTAL